SAAPPPQSPAAAPAIERTRLVPERRGAAQPVAVVTEPPIIEPPVAKAPPSRPRTGVPWAAIATVAVLAAIVAGFFVFRPSGQVEPSPQVVTPSPAPAPAPAPPAPVSPTPIPETPAPSLATLSLQGLPSGMRVLLDDMPIGTIGTDGT